jgi:multiple sugar transport system substrate-binding protein
MSNRNCPFLRLSLAAAACSLLLSSCSNTDGAKEQSAPKVDLNAPAELVFYAASGSVTEEIFEKRIAEPVRKKYPQYKLTYIKPGTIKMAEAITANNVPDVFLFSLTEMNINLLPFGLQHDMTPLIKQYGFDLNRINPAVIQTLKNVSGEGKLIGLPESVAVDMMFYNKNVFDRFGVPYPKDGMTWDEAYTLSRRLTQTSEGVQYRGLSFFFRITLLNNSASLPLIDPKTEKAVVNTDGWKKMFDNFKRFYEISGMMTGFKPGGDGNSELVSFYTDKNVASIVSPLTSYTRPGFEDLNWDMVAAPTFADQKGVGFQMGPRSFYISSTSNAKDQAFQVISYLLSDEIQVNSSKLGQMTSLKSEEVHKTFGLDIPALKGKNTMAVYYNQVAPTPQQPLLSTNAGSLIGKQFDLVIQGAKDVNTALRDAEETINKSIETEIAERKKP